MQRRPPLWTYAISLILLAGTAQARAPVPLPDELLVGIREEIPLDHARAAYREVGAVVVEELPQIRVHRLRVAPAAIEAAEAALSRRPELSFVERNQAFWPDFVPNDPEYPSQWHLPRINAPAAWDLGVGLHVAIAILDTGVDAAHPDLAGKLLTGFNTYDDNGDAHDVDGHGTMVAGAAAALGHNGVGVASVAWGSPILPIRVTDPSGLAYGSTIAQGLVYAVDNGARVVNVSFGGIAGSEAVLAAARYVVEHGGVVIASSGDCGCADPISDTPYILSVAATDRDDRIASFSSSGEHVDLSAPGVDIRTTALGGGYAAASGTSFSSPIVAGVVALMLTVNPDLTSDGIESILATTAEDRGPVGYDTSFGFGRVNASEAVIGALETPLDETAPSVSLLAPRDGASVSGTVRVEVRAADAAGVLAVALYIDGRVVASAASSPLSFDWNTAGDSAGTHRLEAVAFDAAGNQGSSAVSVTVAE